MGSEARGRVAHGAVPKAPPDLDRCGLAVHLYGHLYAVGGGLGESVAEQPAEQPLEYFGRRLGAGLFTLAPHPKRQPIAQR